jgi:hypothetical protein
MFFLGMLPPNLPMIDNTYISRLLRRRQISQYNKAGALFENFNSRLILDTKVQKFELSLSTQID